MKYDWDWFLNLGNGTNNNLYSFRCTNALCIKLGRIISLVLGINASVIQGSGLGPISFVYNASDLHPLNAANKICKYADDFYLIVPSSHSHTIPSELENIANWAKDNNLKLNKSKPWHDCPKAAHGLLHKPLCHYTWDRAGSWDGSPWCNTHWYSLILPARWSYCYPYRSNVICSAPSPIPWPRSHGASHAPQLFNVARATLVAQLTYASPAWAGFINCEDKAHLQSVLKKLQRAGFLPHNFQTFKQICDADDTRLFSSIIHNDDHVLHQLLPPVKTHSHQPA